MKRIAVIGSPGSGKSTFSRKLAKTLNLPLYHLDFYYHDDRFDYTRNKESWRKKVSELTNDPRWIIDGNYKSTFDVRFDKADTIIFLDFPRKTALARVVKRRVQLHGKVRQDMPSNWKEKIEWGLVRTVWTYNKIQRPRIYSMLDGLNSKKQVIILKDSRAADKFLQDLPAKRSYSED